MSGAVHLSSDRAVAAAERNASALQPSRDAAELALEILDATGLQVLDAEEWDALAANALDENPFYARQYVLAGLDTIDRDVGLRALALRRRTDGRLCGLFLFQEQGFPVPRAAAAANLYQSSGTPLVHRDHAEPVIAAWLDALAGRTVPRHWSIANVPLDSDFMQVGKGLAERRGYCMLPVCDYQRAQLRRLGGGFEEHLRTAMSKSRVKDIQRTLRRLGECGELRLERTGDPKLVALRVEDYLRLEHAGWKGAAGTSFLADPMHVEFARRAYGGQGAVAGLASVDSLLLDERPIAISINIQSGRTTFTPKCAFDEKYRRFSPGLALEYLVIEDFYADESCADMDSATTVDGHVVQGLWNAQQPMGAVVVGPRGWRTAALATAHAQRAALKGRAKRALGWKPLAAVTPLLRAWRLRALRSDLLITLACATHAVEGLVKVGL